MYFVTARRMISGGVLKYLNGRRRVIITQGWATDLPALPNLLLTLPPTDIGAQ